jgi:YggT family protein
MGLLAYLISLAFDIYIGIIIIQVLISWLMVFDVINASSPQAQNLIRLLHKATDPIYKPLQKYIPPIGGIDITPIIVIIGLQFMKSIVMGVLI